MSITNPNLSDHFSVNEALFSQTAIERGIINIPSGEILLTMQKAAFNLERVRALFGNIPLSINSWYRCPGLNTAVGSKSTSQHLKGEAIDFTCAALGSPLDLCKRIVANKDLIRFDQLILEHTWVHISFAITTGKPRSQVLSLLETGGYSSGLTNKKGTPV